MLLEAVRRRQDQVLGDDYATAVVAQFVLRR
jgi:hypothetical protein